jgi:glycosyltransferase involved in cell wall biosynthesis
VRLAFVAPAYPYRGGIAHFAGRLAHELQDRSDCLFINFKRLYPEFLFPGATQYESTPPLHDISSERIIDSISPLSWMTAGRRIRNWNPDAVVFHWWHPFFAPAYRSIAGSVGRSTKKIAVCHNVSPHEANLVTRSLSRLGLSGMDGFILHSRSEVADLQSLIPDKPHLNLLHPLYDIFPGEEMPKSEARAKLGLDEDDRIALYFGLIRPYKGVDVLLKSFQNLLDIPRLKLLIVGEIYSDKEMLLELIGKLPSDRVRLVDRYIPTKEVAQYFRCADVVVLPYRSATQSGIVPIAYRCERPVIVSRVGGLPDVVDEGKSGFLVEPGDPQDLGSAVRRFFVELNSPDLLDGIKAVSARLSWKEYADKLRHFIEIIDLETSNA